MSHYTIHTNYYDKEKMKTARNIGLFYNGENQQNIINAIPPNVKSLSLYNIVNPITIPEHIERLSLAKDSKLDIITFSPNLRTLILESQDTIFQNFPESITNLTIYSTKIEKLIVPKNLKKLKLYCISLVLPPLPNLEKLHIYCENSCPIDFLPQTLKTLSLQSYRNSYNFSNLPNLHKLKIHGFAPDLTVVNVKYVKYCDEKPINFPISVEKIKSASHPKNLGKLVNLLILKCQAGQEDILHVPEQLEKLHCCGYDKIVFSENPQIRKIKVKEVNLIYTEFANLPEYIDIRIHKGHQIWEKIDD